MKRFLRDLALILIGGSVVFVGKEAFASNQLPPLTITCNFGTIDSVSIEDGPGGYTVSWRNTGTGYYAEGSATFRECVIGSE